MSTLIPVILAGGAGSRLWPISRELYPKQLLKWTGEDSLLQQSVRRALKMADAEKVLTVTAEGHFFTVLDQLREVDEGLTKGLILEPFSRDTAAAAALAALSALDAHDDPILFIRSSDQAVRSPKVVEEILAEASEVAKKGCPVALLIPTSRKEWGLDYATIGKECPDHAGYHHLVTHFEGSTEEAHTQEGPGGFACGMYVIAAKDLLSALEKSAPALMAGIQEAFTTGKIHSGARRVGKDAYESLIPQTLEEILLGLWGENVLCKVIDPGWSEVGSWSSLWEVSEKDADGNVIQGDVFIEQSKNCMVRSDGRLVALAGVEDLTVVETADAILVAKKSDPRLVSRIMRKLKKAGRSEASNHLKDLRPWGSFSILLEGPRYKIKEIVVKPGASLSLQMHYNRSEHWVVISGTARITRGDEVEILGENQSTYIPIGTRHRLENPGRVPLRIIEVQNGSYLGEDDIVRFQDNYGREGSNT